MIVQRWEDGRVVEKFMATEVVTVPHPIGHGAGLVLAMPGDELSVEVAARHGLIPPKATRRR